MEIPLTKGALTTVDSEDWEKVCDLVGARRWSLATNPHGNRYARCTVRIGGKKRTVFMHRLIMDAPKGMEVDHIDGNGLNNLRCNLRLATTAQNHRNRRKPYGASRYLGVAARPNGKWRAQIKSGGRVVHLGTYAGEVEAALAYDRAARLHHGEFAAPNFPELCDEC